MELNRVHPVETVDRVAVELGKTVDRLHDLTNSMKTEHGIIWIYGT